MSRYSGRCELRCQDGFHIERGGIYGSELRCGRKMWVENNFQWYIVDIDNGAHWLTVEQHWRTIGKPICVPDGYTWVAE